MVYLQSHLPFETIELSETAGGRLRLRGVLDLATADVVAEHLTGLRRRGVDVVLDLDDGQLPFEREPS